MGFINLAEKTISAKLVYYGCGMGGKTTSLQAVHQIMCPKNEVQLVSIKTEEDATLLFDFLPIDLGQVEGFKIRIQGFTVPGQPKYRRMRKYVLQGADAVVFVVDSEASRLDENLASWQSLVENLDSYGLSVDSIPIVLQYNKRDLDDVLSEEALDKQFRQRDDVLAFPSVATDGAGVFETFVEAAALLVEDKVKQYGLDKGIDALAVANGARDRLWDICNDARGGEPLPSIDRFELTFDDDGKRSDGTSAPSLDTDSIDAGEILTDEDLEIDLDALCDPLDVVGDDREASPGESGPQGAVPSRTDGASSTSALDADAAPVPPRRGGSTDFSRTLGNLGDDPEEEPDRAMLDASLESSLELAQRYGELDRMKSLLERKNGELVRLTQNVVHDLNRPLSALRLVLSSMKKGILGELEGKVVSAVDNGLLAVDHMERLISDLIDSSRLDWDGVHLQFAEIDMTMLLAEVVNQLRFDIEAKNVGVRIEPMPVIRGDEWALTKAFMNLLGNAVKYCDPERPGRVWVTCDETPDGYLFAIRDNGIGIPEDDVPRLFQRFVRGNNVHGVSGTGLGLHIIKEVVLGHGGSTWVESTAGEGTTFYVSIPREPVQPPHSVVSDVDPLASTPGAAG